MSLLNLLPIYFKNIKDFQYLEMTEDIEFEEAELYLNQILNNFFVETCDLATLSQHEHVLNIIVNPQDTVDFRRRRVLSRYNSIIPYTLPSFKEKLNDLVGADQYTIMVDANNYTISLEITDGSYGVMDEVIYLLDTMLPAHIARILTQVFRYAPNAFRWLSSGTAPSMEYLLTSDINEKYGLQGNQMVAAAPAPSMEYLLTSDISITYQTGGGIKIGSAASPSQDIMVGCATLI